MRDCEGSGSSPRGPGSGGHRGDGCDRDDRDCRQERHYAAPGNPWWAHVL